MQKLKEDIEKLGQDLKNVKDDKTLKNHFIQEKNEILLQKLQEEAQNNINLIDDLLDENSNLNHMTTAERKEYLKRMRGISREDLVETNLMSDSSEVDSVEKLLLLGKVFAEQSCLLNSEIKRVQFSEKRVATIRLPNKHFNNLFNLTCDDISASEVWVIEDRSENAFREQMLNKHLLNCGFREVRINCGAALFVKICENGDKFRVRFVLFRYEFCGFSTECGDLLFEFCDSGVPVRERGGWRSEEVLECRNQACWIGDVYVKNLFSVLIEDTVLRVLEEDVIEGVTCLAFRLYGFVEIVVYILRFPVGKRKSIFIENHTIENDTIARWRAHCELRNQGSIHLFCADGQQRLKRGAHRAFVCDVVFIVLLQGGIVVSDCFVIRLESELWHWDRSRFWDRLRSERLSQQGNQSYNCSSNGSTYSQDG